MLGRVEVRVPRDHDEEEEGQGQPDGDDPQDGREKDRVEVRRDLLGVAGILGEVARHDLDRAAPVDHDDGGQLLAVEHGAEVAHTETHQLLTHDSWRKRRERSRGPSDCSKAVRPETRWRLKVVTQRLTESEMHGTGSNDAIRAFYSTLKREL